MKRLLIACSVALGLSLGAPGCGGGGADPAAIQAAVEKPTGTFNEAEAQKTFDDAATQQADSSEASAALEGTPVAGFIGGFGGGGGMNGQSADAVALQMSDRVRTATLRTLQGEDGGNALGGGYNCKAPSGASGDANNAEATVECDNLTIKYRIKGAGNMQGGGGEFSLSVEATFKAGFKSEKDSKPVTGTLKLEMSGTGGLSGTAGLDSLKFTYAWDLTVGEKKIEGGMGYYKRRLWLVVKTPSGYLAIVLNGYKTGNETGSIYVRGKDDADGTATLCDKKSASDGWVCKKGVDLAAETTGEPSDDTNGSGDGSTDGATAGATTGG